MTVIPFPPIIPVPDLGQIRQLAEKIKQTIDKIVDTITVGVQKFQEALNKLVQFTLGLAQSFVDGLVAAFNKCVEIAQQIAQKISEAIDWLQGPANVQAVGKAITENYPGPLQQLSDSLLRENLKANADWRGAGAEAFFGSVGRQKGAVDALKGAITSLGTAVTSVGASGLAIQTGFIISVTAAAITATVAIGVAIAFPPAAGAAVPICVAVFALILAVTVAVLVACNALAQTITNAKSSFESQLPGGAHWPVGVGGGGAVAGDAERDATTTDGDADWSTGYKP